MNAVVFVDKSGNHYLYSYSKKRLIYISEILYEIAKGYIVNKYLIPVELLLSKYSEEAVRKSIDKFHTLNNKGYFENIENKFVTSMTSNELPVSLYKINNIAFELTQKCNMRCVYCFYGDLYKHSEHTDRDKELNVEIAYIMIDAIFSQMASVKNNSIKKKIILGFYGGEPLLRFDLVEKIVDYSESHSNSDFYFSYSLTTNGILLRKYIDYMVDHNFSLLISLDGNFENSDYRVTSKGKNLFQDIFETLKYIKIKYPVFFENNISFNSVLHDKNTIANIVFFFRQEFDKIPMLSELSSTCIKEGAQEDFLKMYREENLNYDELSSHITAEEYIQLNRKLKELPSFFYKLLDVNIKNWSDWLCDYDYSYYPTSTCLPFTNKIFVSADGCLHLCEHIGYNYSFAYVDLNKRKIVFDEEKVSKQYSAYYSDIVSKCSKCYMAPFCSICLFERNLKCACVTSKMFVQRMAADLEDLKTRDKII